MIAELTLRSYRIPQRTYRIHSSRNPTSSTVGVSKIETMKGRPWTLSGSLKSSRLAIGSLVPVTFGVRPKYGFEPNYSSRQPCNFGLDHLPSPKRSRSRSSEQNPRTSTPSASALLIFVSGWFSRNFRRLAMRRVITEHAWCAPSRPNTTRRAEFRTFGSLCISDN